MERLVGWAIDHRAISIVVFLMLGIAGVIAWNALSIDAYPDISDTTVQVVTQVPGLATEEIEQQISIPVERAVSGIPNLVTMRSKNSFGISTVVLVFDDGVDDYWARQRVTERLVGIDLPYGAVPELNPLTAPTGEIYRYIVESPDGSHDLRSLTDIHKWTIIPYLRQISGVADVSNYGGITTQYQIELSPERLTEFGVSLSDITEKIEQNNLNAGGSILSEGSLSYVVRGIGLISDLEGLGDIVIKTVNGTPVYLKELGELKYGNLERKGVLGYSDDERNYDDAVEGIVQMLRGENPSEVLDRIHASIDELNNEILPEGVVIHPFLDRTSLVGETLKTVSHTLLIGMLLVVVVLMIFLGNFRGSLVVAITIPVALLVAFVLMKLTGIPANLLSLGAIDFGILVDGAIVMMENILKKRERHPELELTTSDVKQRAREVARSIFFSTIIIITAYLPLFAFEHVERKLFTPMAYTVGYALIGALLTSLLLTPGLSYMAYRKPRKLYHNRWLERLNDSYTRLIGTILEKKRAVLVTLAVILLGSIGLSISVGKDFLPPLDEGSIWVQVQLPSGLSIEQSKKMSDDLRKVLSEFDETSYVMTQLGRDDEGAECFSLSHIECGIGLKPYTTWKSGRTKAELVEAMAAAIERMPGYSAGFSQPIIDMVMDQIAGTHSDLALKIYSDDINESRRVAEEVVKVVSGIKGATDVAVDLEPPTPQLQISVNRASIAQYGLNVADVTELIELAIGGRAISQIYVGSKVYDITCRYAEKYRNTPEAIGNLLLTTADGVKVPLSAVADIKMNLGASTIMREMARRYTLVRINLRGADLSTFVAEADRQIAKKIKYNHESTNLHWAGQFENRNRAFGRLALVVPLALMVMFILLIFAFGKVRQAGLLMVVVPLALFGGMAALNVRGMTLNVSSAVGFIALIGVAIQNGIIMISHINHLRDKGRGLRRAVIEGASHRMRPVLLTASVAVLGLFPASISTGIGSDVQRPLATVIVYGLIFATVVTLFILPSLYYMVELRAERRAADKTASQPDINNPAQS
ncbi:MAG: efflux RND transporter permease subunit [Bacteroidales bacterium]|nr:efflux RND transporter permease subunit [Bacteroidales bacterium]